jgi:hypothetical protein
MKTIRGRHLDCIELYFMEEPVGIEGGCKKCGDFIWNVTGKVIEILPAES